MKKFYLVIALFSLSFNGMSQLLTEPFNYTPHATQGLAAQSAAGASPWFIINTGDSILVDATSLTYAGLAASTGNKVKFDGSGTDYYTNFTSQTSGSVYRSFILNVSSLGTHTATGGYFNGVIQSGSTSLFGATVWTRLSTTPGRFNVGISTRSNSTVTWLATDLTPGTPCFIVAAYDFNPGANDDVARIWLNTSAIGGAEPAADATSAVGTDLTSVARVFLRQDNTSNTPFIEYDELRIGTNWAQVTPSSGASPMLSASALTGFGSVCLNTTAGPNTFTITGTALTNANVTVGALTGFTYATAVGGPYQTSLSLTQPGGAYSQQIFVQFTPTAVQSYNGNIPVGGGGASSINVAATGSGVNTIPTLTTGAASSITTNSATCAGTITSIGCSAITAYGIEYSTTNGFPNGTGTPVASGNLAGGNFTSNLTGLSAGTVYYYHSYATNIGGTGYGSQQTFTTVAAPSLSVSPLTGFGNVCINTTTVPNSFTITGTNLTNANVTVGALAGFSYATTVGGPYQTSLSLSQPGGAYSQQIFVQFSPTAVQSYNGNIPVGGGGASTVNAAATGSGVNSVPSLTTGAASSITTNSATCAGTITSIGCSAVIAYGIEYSVTPGFPNGTGTPVSSGNLAGGNFSSNLIGLTPNTTYYYHSYATNSGGTGYGSEQFFTTQALTPTLSATGLTAFGPVCLNVVAGPNNFTINGSALTNANVNVAALAGFTYSINIGGPYTTTLSLAQPGGTFSQVIYVRFTPTAVQSYNGNIVISGGGAPVSVNVAASGSGVNTMASVTTGAASAVTSISATCAGSIPSIGCSAITAYGIEYSTTNGFPNGSGIPVASGNLSGGNFSSNLTGLAPTTTYYYHAYAANNGGTAYGAQQQFTMATPGMSAGALAAFGAVCINNTAGPNSFTITGTNLTTANVNVGPLTGYTFSTTSGGTYTASLSLVQPGGAYSQQVFVRFTPTAVQSYNGNIPVNGGGAASFNVAASGSGVNTVATVNTGAASAITQTTATLAGSIPATGCSAITLYGIEYSLTNNFPVGTGTQVLSTNLSGGNFSSGLSGLTPSTTYYYRAYATNSGGTAYGNQNSFTTSAPVLTATLMTAFGPVCINTTAGPNSFTISSNALLPSNVNVAALNGYTYSTTANGTYSNSLSLTQPGGAYSQIIYVKFTPTAVQSYNGNINVSGGGAPLSINVNVSGSGINTMATVVTGSAVVNSPNSATPGGGITSIGCSNVTAYGIEYSSIANLPNGFGTKVASGNLAAGTFTTTLNGLVQGATYYYKAYATNNGGTAYGTEKSFTLSQIPGGLVLYNVPVRKGTSMHFTMKDIAPGHYSAQVINWLGQIVVQQDFIINVNFIDDFIQIPGKLPNGVYEFKLINQAFHKQKAFLVN